MTCYESLIVEESGESSRFGDQSPMANHLVKWWKSKFRNGYKQFSVLGSGERTDTEELVGRTPSQCSAPPDLLPSEARALLAPSERSERRPERCTPPSQTYRATPTNDRIRFEELTCDVQVQDGISGADGQQPLQFSFTLYDFDGHGRMTKDDIAGIVSTIYESVGKTVTVPHYGSKTIQVRLTVSPDQRKPANKVDSAAVASPESEHVKSKVSCKSESRCVLPGRDSGKCQTGCLEHKVRFKRDPHAQHVREGRRKPRRRRETCANVVEPCSVRIEASDDAEDERRSRLSIDDDVSECSADLPRAPKRTPRHRHYLKNNLSPRYRNDVHNHNPPWPVSKDSASPSPQRAKESDQHHNRQCEIAHKKRSSSLQRQELLEIIQANMEKNHLSFQTSRKPFEQRGVSSLEGERTQNKNRYRNRSYTFSDKPSSDLFNHKVDHHNNGYLDLAHNNSNIIMKDSNLCRYDSFLHAVICSTAQHTIMGGSQQKTNQNSSEPHKKSFKAHHRSRSHDLAQSTFRYTLLEPLDTDCTSYVVAGKEMDANAADAKVADLKETQVKSGTQIHVSKPKSAESPAEKELPKKNNCAAESKTKFQVHRSDMKVKMQDYDLQMENMRKTNLNCKKINFINHSCSPHHLKHQNREKYHARAMAQVEKWLEADNNTRLKCNKFKKFTETEMFHKLEHSADCGETAECRGLPKSTERSEEQLGPKETLASSAAATVHRCVHEHIHHHYVHCSH